MFSYALFPVGCIDFKLRLLQRIVAMCRDFFRLLLVEHRKFSISFTPYAQKHIELRVYRLRVAVFSALDE